MSDGPTRSSQRRTRLFLVVFIGAALLLALTTIVGTLTRQAERAEARQDEP